MADDAAKMNDIYKSAPLKNIPWNFEKPPEQLVELVNTGSIKPCRAIDLGCGMGHYAIYLASLGFDMTGVDFSSEAIRIARQNARKAKVECRFLVADLLVCSGPELGTFGFAYDWEVIHHIFPKHREKYLRKVYRLLESDGVYLSVSFSEKDHHFGGVGKVRKTPLGTELYFSSEDEIMELFRRFFDVVELKTVEVRGKTAPHLANYVLAKKGNKKIR